MPLRTTMRWDRVATRAVALALSIAGPVTVGAAATPKATDCAHSPILVGQCFTVHGRLMLYQGFWNYRIWPIGTHRLLAAVSSNGACCENVPIVPSRIDKALNKDPDGAKIFADWVVCPITRERPGVMQQVCIESAIHVVVRDTPMKSSPVPDQR